MRFRVHALLAASYFFYACWNWKFVPVLLLLTGIDYFAARWIAEGGRLDRRPALSLSVIANLGFLAVFKYYNFATANIAWLLGKPEDSFFVAIVLPLGISFHTFQSISYVVDVYRGEQEPIRDFGDYALFIAFFPQLVAGPIVRAQTFFRDLYNWRAPEAAEIRRGCFLIVFGMVKKLVVADNFGLAADGYFSAIPAHPGALAAWGGAVSFAMQVFFDFSGYSDMAIGSALLLGFHFPENFRQPFLAISVTDFWRRWHITLSTWLRDYLYFPLGGGRKGNWIACRNLVITMTVAGLWHGAKWGYVTWGLFNGILLACERTLRINRIRDRPLRFSDIPAVLITFGLFCLGVTFVRANTMRDALRVFVQMVSRPGDGSGIGMSLFPLLFVSAGIAVREDRRSIDLWIERLSTWQLGLVLGCLLFVVEILGQHSIRNFYYFQF